jgi:hypothetical protein
MLRCKIFVAMHNNLTYSPRNTGAAEGGAPQPNEEFSPMSNGKKPKAEAPEAVSEMMEAAEMPKSANEFAQKSVANVEAVIENAAGVAHETVQIADAAASAFKSRAADLQLKAIENFQANMSAAFAHTRKVFETRDPAEFIKLQQNFAKERMEAFASQTAELNALAVAMARETLKPAQDTVLRGFSSFTKPFAA